METETKQLIDAIRTTPIEQFELRTEDGALENLLTDTLEISIETLTDDERKTLSLHFIGRTHRSDFDLAVFEQLRDFRPNVIIHECCAETLKQLQNVELIQASSVLSLPIELAIPEKVAPTWVQAAALDVSINDISGVNTLIRSSRAQPLLRKMDLTLEELARQTGFEFPTRRTFGYHTINLLKKLGIDDIRDVQQTPDLESALIADANTIQIRDNAMVLDISRIAGNLRRKMVGGLLRIAVISGNDHAQFLQKEVEKKGIVATRYSIVDEIEPHPLDTRIYESLTIIRNQSTR